MYHIGIQYDDEFFIVPTSKEEIKQTASFNHSCEPNCGFNGSLRLVAIRDIQKGEELTLDYAFCESSMEDLKCNCKSENCRKIIKADDWMRKDLQKKYGNYFSPYLKARFL